jgi:hypothetical protein
MFAVTKLEKLSVKMQVLEIAYAHSEIISPHCAKACAVVI